MDDVVIKTKHPEDFLKDIEETFSSLRKYRWKLNPEKCVFGVPSGKLLGFIVSNRGIEANPEKIAAITNMQPPKSQKQIQKLTRCMAALNRSFHAWERMDYRSSSSLRSLTLSSGRMTPSEHSTS